MSYSENQYLKLLSNVLKYGKDSDDRTGTGMRSLFGETMEFDLREGFPLLTTKKMFTRGVFAELLWFLSGSTSNAELEEKYNVRFWREWQDENHQLPNIYGKQWTRWESQREIVKIKRKTLKSPIEEFNYKISELIDPEEKLDKKCLSGEMFKSRIYGEFRVITQRKRVNMEDGQTRSFYDVQFIKTGYVSKNVRQDQIIRGNVYDPFYPATSGIGYLGFENRSELKIDEETYKDLYNCWIHMLHRCYDKTTSNYNKYGGKGIFVDQRWFCFKNFVEDVQKLPNWHLKKKNLKLYNLDKDYYESNCYSKETCVWLSKEENATYRSVVNPIVEINTGQKYLSISEARRHINSDSGTIRKSIKNNTAMKNGMQFTYLDYDKETFVYRYALPFNQIQYIIDQIKTNPTSRRILFTGWNAPEMQWEDTALPCCHSTVVQFYVEDGYLNMYHYQRSGDLFLGVPVNIASYATLLSMIAQQTDLKPGTMKHTIGIAHIYHNHLLQVEEQLTRSPYELPQLNIKRVPNSIFDYQLDDFEVVSYKHHPLIKGDVAI